MAKEGGGDITWRDLGIESGNGKDKSGPKKTGKKQPRQQVDATIALWAKQGKEGNQGC